MSHKPRDPLHRIKNATRAEKAAAFEWLRAQALAEGNPGGLHAAVLMEELRRLNKGASEGRG